MNKFFVCSIFIILAVVSCNSQSNNDSQRIVGTWISGQNKITFDSNGTYQEIMDGEHYNGKYFLSGSKIIFKDDKNEIGEVDDYYLSPNYRILALEYDDTIFWYDKQ